MKICKQRNNLVEYKVKASRISGPLEETAKQIEQKLNTAGVEGWDLCGIYKYDITAVHSYLLVFKRSKG